MFMVITQTSNNLNSFCMMNLYISIYVGCNFAIVHNINVLISNEVKCYIIFLPLCDKQIFQYKLLGKYSELKMLNITGDF